MTDDEILAQIRRQDRIFLCWFLALLLGAPFLVALVVTYA